MVATRHSLPGAASEEPADDGPVNKKTKNALKKLQINGKGTLFGEKRADGDAEAVETFHYRGASYVVTANTKREWVDNQPSRWRKSLADMDLDMDDVDGGAQQEIDEDDDEPYIPTSASKRRRQSSLKAFHEPQPKRSRRSAPEATSNLFLDGANSVGEETPRRTRRNLPTVYYGRPRREPGDSTRNTPKKPRRTYEEEEEEDEDDMPNSIRYDYAVVGGQDEKSCQEAYRDYAIAQGYEVEPIQNKFDPKSPDNQLAMKVGKNLAQLARVNSTMDSLIARYKELDEQLQALRERGRQREAEKAADEIEADIRRAGIASEPPIPSNEETPIETPRARSASPRAAEQPPSAPDPASTTQPASAMQALNEVILLDDGDSITVDLEPMRHDSAASITPNEDNKTTAENQHTPPDLPETNRGGQRLRWSLPSNLTNPDRAETNINRQRLDGESKSARRRRIKRELDLIRDWKTQTDADTQEAGDGDDAALAAE